jgi:putative DNA primase/helicase
MSVSVNATAQDGPDRPRIDRGRVLAGLDLAEEFRALGIKFTSSKPNAKGWMDCRAWNREDANPSAGCNITTGQYKDQASGEKACSIFDLAVQMGRHPSAMDAMEYYAGKAGLVVKKPKSGGKGWRSFDDALAFLAKAEGGSHGGTWTYQWPDGSEAFRVVRIDVIKNGMPGKTIRPFHRNEEGRWRQGQIEGKRPLYQLPELLAQKDAPVWIVEGEKCADALIRLGYVATTSAHGSKSPQQTDWSPLRDRTVLICPDNDRPGEEYAQVVTALIRSSNPEAKLKTISLPGLDEGEDVVDWIRRQPSQNPRVLWNELDRLVEASPWVEVAKADVDRMLSRMPCTDLGNAERLVGRHGRNLRYCHVWSKWLHWSGKHWAVDRVADARRLAKGTVRSILGEAMTADDLDHRKKLAQWAVTSEKRDKIAAMLHLAEAEVGIPILPEDMDADPWLFNVRNGTIDLQTGQLRPHRREDRITKLADVNFDPEARCPNWLATLEKFFARPDPNATAELIEYFQRLCGYVMTGVIREQIMPVAYGLGSNGKSTILGALLDVFGPDYAMKCPPDLLMAKKGDAHPTDRADLFGRRLVVAIESESGRRLNETMVKELTGGDRIRARRMREDFWEFSPTHKLVMATNHKPRITGRDNGIWRRIRLVPFTVTVSGSEANLKMPELLRSEAAGILAWCVRGCLKWQAGGLTEPAEVSEATASYRQEQDVIGAFLEEKTVRLRGIRVKSSQLYGCYQAWCQASGESALTLSAFGTTLTELGIEKARSGGIWYLGIGLRDERAEEKGAPEG